MADGEWYLTERLSFMIHLQYNVKFYQNPATVDYHINDSGLFNSGIRAVSSAIYELYFNTRKASQNNKDFYDKKRKDYYIIFKNDQIKAIKHFSANAINKAKKLLKKLGLIETVPQKWNQPDKIFLLNFNQIISSINSKTPGQSKAESLKKKTSKTISNNVNNTNNTRKLDMKKMYLIQKKHNKLSKRDLKTMLKRTIEKTTLTRIPEQIADISDTPNFYHHIIRLLLNAKISVKRDIKAKVGKASKFYKLATNALKFEKNLLFYDNSRIAKSVYWIIRKAYKTALGYHDKYIMKSFKNLFKAAVHSYKINHQAMNGPKIPILQI